VTLLWWVLGTVFVPMFVGEFTDVCPWLARKLIHRAARRIPEPDRSRWESEFLSDLEEQPGRIWKLIWSVGVYRGAWQMRRMLGAPSTIEALRARLEAALRKLRARTPAARPEETKPEPAPNLFVSHDAVLVSPHHSRTMRDVVGEREDQRRRERLVRELERIQAGAVLQLREIHPGWSEQDLNGLLDMSAVEFARYVDGKRLPWQRTAA